MFTGIIEEIAVVENVQQEQGNIHFTFSSSIAKELKVDQSIAHNGVCLTVTSVNGLFYTVTAINETLRKSNLKSWNRGSVINLERCMKLNDRLDGHIVQGHVDCTAICKDKIDENGSWKFTFEYEHPDFISVDKGSICVNGVSLTVVDSKDKTFSVCIIPYTYEHTNFKSIEKGDEVNLEFDIIGKYVSALMKKS
ncbi:MAG: riboflavin synthase [Flavobacteriia bacterium]|nr:riboflavin synthase [Flavobacteriia bacterium]